MVDPEEAQGPARGLVALAAHGGRELEREAKERTTTATTDGGSSSRCERVLSLAFAEEDLSLTLLLTRSKRDAGICCC